jgi:hypothetical protein
MRGMHGAAATAPHAPPDISGSGSGVGSTALVDHEASFPTTAPTPSDLGTSSALVPPAPGAPLEDVKAWMELQLDLLGDSLLLGKYELLGAAQRRIGGMHPCILSHAGVREAACAGQTAGATVCMASARTCMAHMRGASAGQAVVQFARRAGAEEEVALKFFVSRRSFDAEKAIYTNMELRKLLPRLQGLHDNNDGTFVDPHGNPLPPCIIMERGESLDEWSCCRLPDMWAAMPVCSLC